MSVIVRPIVDSEYAELGQRVARAFGGDAAEDDAERLRELIEPSRTMCAFDGSRMIGTCAGFPLRLAVPGATLPMTGTTIVSVEPTHRRRGVLREMMRSHLQDVRARGEPLAGLWASEGVIYPRFGFGAASEGNAVSVDGAATRFRGDPPSLDLRMIEASEAADVLPPLYEKIWQHYPGLFGRHEAWWRTRILRDREQDREGASAYRFVVCEQGGDPLGYVIYRLLGSEKTFGRGQVQVRELMTLNDAAHEVLWRYLCRIDLFPLVKFWNAAVDDELKWRVTDPYRVERRVIDNLWLRLMDVPGALSARRYLEAGDLVLEVVDGFDTYAAGRFKLEAHPQGAHCQITSEPADIELDVTALGSLYLGRRCAMELRRAGRIAGDDKSLRKIERLMAWSREPWCAEVF